VLSSLLVDAWLSAGTVCSSLPGSFLDKVIRVSRAREWDSVLESQENVSLVVVALDEWLSCKRHHPRFVKGGCQL